MTRPSGAALVPIILLVFVLATDLWVFADARAHLERGTPVAFSTALFTVDTPVAWFVSCLVLWILFFPLYMTLRRQAD